jgi:type IV secretion system protein VirD4
MSDWKQQRDVFLKRGTGRPGELVNARWLDEEDLLRAHWRHRDAGGRAAGIVLGYMGDIAVGSTDNRHIVTVAGSRGGKGVSLIVPNLLLYDGSVLAIDPKGELAEITARARRQKGQKVVILDPWNTSNAGDVIASYNPLDELDLTSRGVIDDAAQIADGLITPSEREPHFTDSARNLVKAVILYTLSLRDTNRNTKMPERKDLTTVWKLLEGSHPDVIEVAARGKIGPRKALFLMLQTCDAKVHDASGIVSVAAVNDTVRAAGRNFDEVPERELGSVYSTALTQLEFLSSELMAPVLASSDFRLSQLKSEKATLFLCLPAMAMGTHSRWLRVIINMALVALERTRVAVDIPVLFVLDEFAVLGHMKSIETAAGFIAGHGVKLWMVLQDLTQMKRLYKDGWETFIGNAGVTTYWSNSDKFTLDYLSNALGQTTVTVDRPVELTAQQRFSGALSTREENRVQRLAAPDELEQMLERGTRNMLVRVAGRAPIVIERIVYHDPSDSNFAGLYDTRKYQT